jgi:hypothetical protein
MVSSNFISWVPMWLQVVSQGLLLRSRCCWALALAKPCLASQGILEVGGCLGSFGIVS